MPGLQRERRRADGDAVSSPFSTEVTLFGVQALTWTASGKLLAVALPSA
jgi:hypothetical protein